MSAQEERNMKRDWLHILSNVAIVIGLFFLIYELNQSHKQARATLVNDDMASVREHLHTVMGENPAAAIAKARMNHESLSEEEKVVLDAHFRTRLSQLSTYEYITAETGVYKNDWRDVVPVVIRQTFDYEYARLRVRAHLVV
jgi:hypothetical protein